MTKNRWTDSAVSLTPRTREVEVSGINDVAESFESVGMSEFLRLLFCKLWTCDTFIAKVFSLTRVVMNVSQLAGPWVGGMLYELDGFYLPFLTIGAIQVKTVSSLLVDIANEWAALRAEQISAGHFHCHGLKSGSIDLICS